MGIVIINGKRYDSVTGLMLSDQVAEPTTSESTSEQAVMFNGTPGWVANYVDDGIKEAASETISEAASTDIAATVAVETAEVVEAASPTTTNQPSVQRYTAPVSARRSVTMSHTLNRRYVKKPLGETGEYAASIAEQTLSQAPTAATSIAVTDETSTKIIPEATSQVNVQPESNFIPLLTRRQAEGVKELVEQQKPLAERVADEIAKQAEADTAPVKVQPTIDLSNIAGQATATSDRDDILNERLDQLSKILQNVQELDEQQATSQRRTNDKKALASQPKPAKKAQCQPAQPIKHKRRFAMPAIMTTAAAMATIAGIGVYVAMPSISVKIAANKAGIEALDPYIPEGYSIDNEVAYQAGRMTVNYRSESGSDGYSITKEKTNKDDSAIRQDVSSQSGGYYQEIQAGDQTVLLYSDKATWLKDNMRYTIDSNDYLDLDQITSIVNSL